MTQTLNRAARIFTLLATIYIMTLSAAYTLGTINTVNDINEYQGDIHDLHLTVERGRTEFLTNNSPQFDAAMKDPYFKSADYQNIVKAHLDSENEILQAEQNTLAKYKTQADRFVFAREAYKNLEKSFPEDTTPFMDEQMALKLFLVMSRNTNCADVPPTDPPTDPYVMIGKKYNFCSIK